MRNLLVFVFAFFILSVALFPSISSAQSASPSKQKRTLKDFGLTEESVKYLSPKEIEDILTSMTPEETAIEMEKREKAGSTSTTPFFAPLSVVGGNGPTGTLENTVNCFDYYHFGSVQTDLSLRSSNIVSGMNAEFTGTITNNNPYPVVGGTLYVKMFKERGREKDANGPDVIDQFVAMDNVVIPAGSSVPASFSWKVPNNVRGGNYRIASFFQTDKKFNLLGLSFTDDVVGNTFDFRISAPDSSVYFDKSSVTINNQAYLFAAFPPRIEDKDSVDVSATVKNTTNKDETVEVKWNLYRWDSVNPQNFVRTISTTVLVKARSSAVVKVNIPEKDSPVYYLLTELKYKDSKSILGIRYVRDGVDRVRLNFPGVMSFPLEKGKPTSMFSCVHNSGTSDVVSDNKIVLELTDNTTGKVIDSYTYQGGVSGAMMAVKKDFIPTDNIDSFTMHASLYHAGTLVDESTIVYDCNTIDPTKCNPKNNYKMIPAIIGLVILLLLAGWKLGHKKMSVGMFLLLALFSMNFLSAPKSAEAKSVSWNEVDPTMLYAYFSREGANGSGWYYALSDRNVTVNYNAEIRNSDTGEIINTGSTIPIDTNITFKFIPHVSNDIYWFGTGYGNDSPYGDWVNSNVANTAPAISCQSKDYTNDFSLSYWGGGYKAYSPLVIKKPNKTITDTDGLSCGVLSGNEISGYSMSCVVTTAGILHPKFNFGSTVGEFFYRYYDPQTYEGRQSPGCYGNNVPLHKGNYNRKNITNAVHYYLNVPAQVIEYTLTAQPSVPPGNVPPNPPTITGPVTALTGDTNSFGIVATDSDNDRVKYAIDWDGNTSTIEQWLPSSGLADSGVLQSVTRSWGTATTSTFNVKTLDSYNQSSAWVPHTIVVNNPPPLTASCTVDRTDPPPGGSVIYSVSFSGGKAPYASSILIDGISPPPASAFTVPNPYSSSSYNISLAISTSDTSSHTLIGSVRDSSGTIKAIDMCPTISPTSGGGRGGCVGTCPITPPFMPSTAPEVKLQGVPYVGGVYGAIPISNKMTVNKNQQFKLLWSMLNGASQCDLNANNPITGATLPAAVDTTSALEGVRISTDTTFTLSSCKGPAPAYSPISGSSLEVKLNRGSTVSEQ